jgi:ATP-dependent Clp protease ATP-binding subunit ClpX
MAKQKVLRCSFCDKDETQVAKLVAGPGVYICDACVQTAMRIMEQSADNQEAAVRLTPSAGDPAKES